MVPRRARKGPTVKIREILQDAIRPSETRSPAALLAKSVLNAGEPRGAALLRRGRIGIAMSTASRQQLGHYSPAFTLSTYGHLLPRDRRGEVDCLDDASVCTPGASSEKATSAA